MTDIQEDGVESLESFDDLADADLREDETSDPDLAAEEGLAYVPPTDPPVIPADNDLDDSDALVAIASEAAGVVEVRDELEVPGL